MNTNEKRPEVLREPQGAKDKKYCCASLVALSRHQVNEPRVSGLLFGRDLLLAGLACLGWPWSRHLSLWVDWLDSRSEALRNRQGVRA